MKVYSRSNPPSAFLISTVVVAIAVVVGAALVVGTALVVGIAAVVGIADVVGIFPASVLPPQTPVCDEQGCVVL